MTRRIAYRRPPACCGILVFLGLLAGSLLAPFVPAAAAPTEHRWRVAMMDFTTDDDLMRSADGGAQWAALAQAALAAQEPGIDWIERAQLQLAADELELSAGGFTSTNGSLRIGKWLHANLAILGHFTRGENNDAGHDLRLEIVDLDRADTLATRTLHLEGDRREAIVPRPARVAETAVALQQALTEAEAKLARASGQRVLAPLFFRNADPSPRLNHFQDDLLNACSQTGEQTGDVRVLRFAQAEEARGEADLLVSGLAEADANAWQHVADLYVWGFYRESAGPARAFAQTPVEIELTLWDGVRPPWQVTAKATVAELPALAQRLAQQCVDAARQVPKVRPAAGSARAQVSQILRAQGQHLEATAASHGVRRDVFAATPEGHALAAEERLLLAAACFFNPADATAQLAWLNARWPGFPHPHESLRLLDLWRESDDLAAYAARFGHGDDHTVLGLAEAQVDTARQLLDLLNFGRKEIHEAGSQPDLPVDATDANIAAWQTALDQRFARKTAAFLQVAGGRLPPDCGPPGLEYASWMRSALLLTRDPAAAASVVEALWPFYQPYYAKSKLETDRMYDLDGGSLEGAVLTLYSRLGQPGRADVILGSVATKANFGQPVAAAPASPAQVTGRAALPRLLPNVRALSLPQFASPPVFGPRHHQSATLYTVHALAVGTDDLLWIAASRRQSTPPMMVPDKEAEGLWRYDPANDSLQDLPIAGPGLPTPVACVLPQAGLLWLAVEFNGVWQYDLANERVARRYSTADGLVTANLDTAVAGPDGRLYFAGHENGQPLLSSFNAGQQTWGRPSLTTARRPAAAVAGAKPPVQPDATQVAAFQHWVLLGAGDSWTVIDTTSGHASDLRGFLPTAAVPEENGAPEPSDPAPPRSQFRYPRTCTADAQGFWLAFAGRILQFDPAHPKAAKAWPLPAELPEGVTALASDNEDLWIAGPTLRPRLGEPAEVRGAVALLHEADGRWRGGFDLPGPVTCLAMSQQAVYAGLEASAQGVLEIDKTMPLPAAPH